MSLPLVSIIIPTYNRLFLLLQAIENALEQRYSNIEIIIIDDGSSDGTQAHMENFDHPKVHYVYKENGGPSTARNEGVRRASGKYIAFMDSDDLWDNTKLETQINYLEAHPAVGLVTCNYRFIDFDGKVIKDPGKDRGYTLSRGFIHAVLDITFPIATTSTFVLRTSICNKSNLFNERLKISEDLDLWIRTGLEYEVAYQDNVLVSVRLHDDHLMRQTARHSVWHQSVAVLETHKDKIRHFVPDYPTYFARFYSIAGNLALVDGLRRKAFCIYLQALKNAPNSYSSYKNLMRCFLPLSYLKSRYAASLVNHDKTLKNYG